MGVGVRRRATGRPARVAVLAFVLVTTSACGFLNDLAHPEARAAAPEASRPTTAAPVAPAPDPDAPVVIAEGDLLLTGGGPLGHLVVTQGPVRTGLVPPVPGFSEDCPVDGPALQYVAVHFTYTTTNDHAAPQPGLAAHVAVSRGPATPADVGDVGVFADSSGDPGPYCADHPPLPTRDRFWNQMGATTVTVYVVVDQAVSAAFPGGRADVFPTLQLEVSHLRWFREPGSVRTLGPGRMSVGAACTDDPGAICVPLR
jgi:hypothetical protein